MTTIENTRLAVEELRVKIQNGDIDGGKSLIAKLKIAMLDFPMDNNEYIQLATSILELGVLLSIADEDLAAFARNVAQIKTYYSSTATTVNNDMKCKVLGLNLMYLLVENRLSEFHSELELLVSGDNNGGANSNNPFISFPINLERQLMVGSYDEVLNAGAHIPDESYQFFMDNLLQTVRDSIADCLEVAYKTMSISEAKKMMKFDNNSDSDELMEYIEEYRDDWIVDESNYLCFQPPPGGCKASDIPSMKLIAQNLSYATELERIV